MKSFDKRALSTEAGPVGCLINEIISQSSVQTLLRYCESHLCFSQLCDLGQVI